MRPPRGDIGKVCRTCGLPFVVSVDEQLELQAIAKRAGWIHSPRVPSRCLPCRKADRQERFQQVDDTPITRACVDCGAPFVWPIDAGEAAYFRARNYAPPRRCELCRAARR